MFKACCPLASAWHKTALVSFYSSDGQPLPVSPTLLIAYANRLNSSARESPLSKSKCFSKQVSLRNQTLTRRWCSSTETSPPCFSTAALACWLSDPRLPADQGSSRSVSGVVVPQSIIQASVRNSTSQAVEDLGTVVSPTKSFPSKRQTPQRS